MKLTATDSAAVRSMLRGMSNVEPYEGAILEAVRLWLAGFVAELEAAQDAERLDEHLEGRDGQQDARSLLSTIFKEGGERDG